MNSGYFPGAVVAGAPPRPALRCVPYRRVPPAAQQRPPHPARVPPAADPSPAGLMPHPYLRPPLSLRCVQWFRSPIGSVERHPPHPGHKGRRMLTAPAPVCRIPRAEGSERLSRVLHLTPRTANTLRRLGDDPRSSGDIHRPLQGAPVSRSSFVSRRDVHTLGSLEISTSTIGRGGGVALDIPRHGRPTSGRHLCGCPWVISDGPSGAHASEDTAPLHKPSRYLFPCFFYLCRYVAAGPPWC